MAVVSVSRADIFFSEFFAILEIKRFKLFYNYYEGNFSFRVKFELNILQNIAKIIGQNFTEIC